MERFLHISDLHNKGAQQLKYIAEHYPDHKLIDTGDSTHNGTRSEYWWVQGHLIGPFGRGRIFDVPGNHNWAGAGFKDRMEKAKCYDTFFRSDFAISREPIIRHIGPVTLIGLNSNPGTFGWWLDFAKGKVGIEQRDILDAMLGRKPINKAVIVCLHHHLQDPDYARKWYRWFYNRAMELSDSDKLVKILKGRCNLVLHGHRHGQYDYEVEGIKVHCAGALFEQSEALEISVNTAGQIDTRYVPVMPQ